jgi:hypothetical protein
MKRKKSLKRNSCVLAREERREEREREREVE